MIGSNGVVELNGVMAAINGISDTLYFNGGQNVASATGSQEAFVFQSAIGENSVTGFGATDRMQFSKSDFANWNTP